MTVATGRKNFAAMEARGSSGDSAARAALRSRIANPTSIRLDELQPNPGNPRYDDEDPEVQELAETLQRVGQLQPALVVSSEQYLRAYPHLRGELGPQPWVVIVGNRRLAASHLAGRRSLDVRVDSELETAEDLEDRILIENLQRKDLPPLLEAEHLQRRLDRPGETVRSVGAAVGKSHTYVQQRIDLLHMLPEFQELFRRGQINIKTGRQLGTQPEAEQRAILAAGPPFAVGRPRSEQDPAGMADRVNRVSTAGEQADPASTPEEGLRGTVAVNRVSTADPDRSAGPDPLTGSSTRDESGNPVYRIDGGGAGESDRGNPVYTSDGDRAAPAGPPVVRAASGVQAAPAGEGIAASTPVPSAPFPGHHDIEATRASVSQWLDNALTELDRALPASGGGAMGQALADARRCINDARTALDQVPHPAPG